MMQINCAKIHEFSNICDGDPLSIAILSRQTNHATALLRHIFSNFFYRNPSKYVWETLYTKTFKKRDIT